MVSQDVVKLHMGDIAPNLHGVKEALAALGAFRALRRWHQRLEFRRDGYGVYHCAFRGSRVCRYAANADRRRRGVERLPIELTKSLAVNGIGPCGAEPLKIKQGGAMAYLLIWHEGNLQGRVCELRLGLEPSCKRAYLSNACLVICREQG